MTKPKNMPLDEFNALRREAAARRRNIDERAKQLTAWVAVEKQALVDHGWAKRHLQELGLWGACLPPVDGAEAEKRIRALQVIGGSIKGEQRAHRLGGWDGLKQDHPSAGVGE
jgi:hypothetical protein